MGERLRMLDRDPRKEAEYGVGVALVAVLAGERGEPQEAEGRRRVSRWDRVVLGVLAARDQLLVVVRRREEATALGVREAVDHLFGGPRAASNQRTSKVAS